MKHLREKILISNGDFINSDEFKRLYNHIIESIKIIDYPYGSGSFTLYDGKESNGVTPIKNAFIHKLDLFGWSNEKKADIAVKSRRFDSSIKLSNGSFFAVEWETGNISSSHRSLNRIFLGMECGLLSGGVLVIPSRKMYKYLTGRVGSYQELESFFRVWELLGKEIKDGVLMVIEIEHDAVSKDVLPIKKMNSGNSKKNKKSTQKQKTK